ncbi:MAG: S1 RNA-binding domain-containing protein [Candidatus Peribacteria bacterium]|jgi:small subunit ribosomal protein S1|nr:S1 RNA-binding domain-containing protein [Candidatus Peribacteria bacterium]
MAKKTTTASTSQFNVPLIKEGQKITGVILKEIENGILVDCENGAFTGVILAKEAKELKRSKVDLDNGTTLELEIINPAIRHEDGYYIVSVTRLLQYDVWKSVIDQFEKDIIITVVPTEANLGGLLIDMHGIKGFVPLSQLAPIHYPRVEDGDQEAIFGKLLELIGQEIKVRVINIDEEERRIILSEREALREERDQVLSELAVGKIFDGVVSGVSSYGLFVTIGGTVEGLVHISEITYGHVNNIEGLGKIGDKMQVKVIGLENGKISLSAKQLKGDPWSELPKKYKVGDVFDGKVVRFVPYGVFVRVFDDINGLVHLSELSQKSVNNPNEVVKIGQDVKVKLILLDPERRKIGLSMKDFDEHGNDLSVHEDASARVVKKKDLAEVAKMLEEEEAEEEKQPVKKPNKAVATAEE